MGGRISFNLNFTEVAMHRLENEVTTGQAISKTLLNVPPPTVLRTILYFQTEREKSDPQKNKLINTKRFILTSVMVCGRDCLERPISY